MNRAKKLISLLMALMMVVSMSCSALAESAEQETATTKIIIEGGAKGAEYAAFRLLNATNAADDKNKYAYTLNEKYTAVLQDVTGKQTEAEIIEYISRFDTAGIRKFADDVYAKIKAAGIAADETTDYDAFPAANQGYYLIAETKLSQSDAGDTFSLVMLDTVGIDKITVTTKESKPEVDKQVQEKNDSTGATSWGDQADYDVGDVIEYKITGTVSEKYADYESYYYSFSDTMSEGLTLNAESIKVTIGDSDVTDQFVIESTTTSFTATANLKELNVALTGDSKVIVTYTATLNEKAVVGAAGNQNTVILKYENDPYHKGDGDGNPKTPNEPEKPGETPPSINVVFTYDAIVNKTDINNQPLKGAGFTLYKYINEKSDWVAVGNEITGGDVTTFKFEKLDAGKYKLVETTVPAGFNKAADIVFEIVATYVTDSTTGLPVIDSLTVTSDADTTNTEDNTTVFAFTADKATGSVTTAVVNKSGVELPSTGGVGTTMLYVGGGALIAVAVAMLVAKKRKA